MDTYEKFEDEQLLLAMKAGEEKAFVALYRRMHTAVFRFAFQMCGSRDIAEDVTQDVFLLLLREPERFDPAKGSLSSFLYGITRNYVLQRLRCEKSFISMTDTGHHETENSANSRDNRNEAIKVLHSAVLSLPPHYREAIVLCELNELSYAEAAQIVGCAIGTLRSRLNRARALLLLKLQSTSCFAKGEMNDDAASGETLNPSRCFV